MLGKNVTLHLYGPSPMLAELTKPNPKLNHFTYYKPDYAPPPTKPRNSFQVRATVDGRNLAPIDK